MSQQAYSNARSQWENEQSKGSFSGNRDAHNLLEQRSANAERTFKRARAYPFG